MFFGVLSINTIWFSYYAVSKWGRKPLASMKLAAISFWIMEGAIILLFLDTVLHFGAGWYNLMPLTFLPGFPVITWDLTAAIIFQIADVLVGIAITIFCIVILATLLRGKLPVGNQMFEYMYEKDEGDQKYHEHPLVRANRDVREIKNGESSENGSSEEKITDKQIKIVDQEFRHREDLPASIRWVSLIGINAWFPKK
jgi:heme/copper-type cytochrome/quinol oxidase subunit 1